MELGFYGLACVFRLIILVLRAKEAQKTNMLVQVYIHQMPKFVPRERKHKVRKRHEENGNGDRNGHLASNPNAVEILSSTSRGKEERRKAMKDALRAQQPQMSSKKQKRLDKYIVCMIYISTKVIQPTHFPGEKVEKGRKP